MNSQWRRHILFSMFSYLKRHPELEVSFMTQIRCVPYGDVYERDGSRYFTKRNVRAQMKETPQLRITGLCENSSVTGEFPTQRDSDAENVSIWWRHRELPRWESHNMSPIATSIVWKRLRWASNHISKNAGCACAGNAGNFFPATDFKGNRGLAIPACITARDACRDR